MQTEQSISFPAAAAPASTPAVGAPINPAAAATVQKPPAPAGLPLAAAIPAWALAAAAPAAPTVSLDAPVATVYDRRVRLVAPNAPEQPSLYRLCRQWVQNDPDLGEYHEPIPASKLPPLPPTSEEAAAVMQQAAPIEAPLPAPPPAAAAPEQPSSSSAAAAAGAATDAGTSGTELPAVETLMQNHKQHWAEVRKHKQEQTSAAQQRFAQRLQSVLTLSGGTVPAAAPVAMEH